MIVKDSGSHFDPAVVAAFVDAEAEFIAIRTRFGEQSRAAA
jgi:response regulator RpfG family c-di-GMP phosphodiesterase